MDDGLRLGTYAWLLTMEEAMSEALEIYDSLAAALPESADAREELIALGMVATGVISAVPHEDRAELVDTFCKMLRLGVAGELHS